MFDNLFKKEYSQKEIVEALNQVLYDKFFTKQKKYVNKNDFYDNLITILVKLLVINSLSSIRSLKVDNSLVTKKEFEEFLAALFSGIESIGKYAIEESFKREQQK